MNNKCKPTQTSAGSVPCAGNIAWRTEALVSHVARQCQCGTAIRLVAGRDWPVPVLYAHIGCRHLQVLLR
jgi:hypothetical protein